MAKRINKKTRKLLLAIPAVLIGLPLALILIFRFAPVPITPLMLIRMAEGEGLQKTWVAADQISPHVARAIIASEDNLFCEHWGFDSRALGDAIENWASGKHAGGGSTISMQTAKNLFLWPDRSVIRKAIEAPLTLGIEALWPKRRILEVYSNIAEFGPGIYGIEAAAQHHFGKSAAKLSQREAALLASILPNPRERSAGRPSAFVRSRASIVEKRIGQLGPLLNCAA